MAKLRLYTSPSAFPNPQRLRLFMFEKAITGEFEEIIYDMTPGGEQRKWQHLKMNPWGEAPTLQLEDGSYIAETTAIARYLDLRYPGRTHYGQICLGARVRYHVGQPHLGAYSVPDRNYVSRHAPRLGVLSWS